VRRSVSHTIAAIELGDGGANVIYDNRFAATDEPEDIDYHCRECGYVPRDRRGEVVRGTDSFLDWLIKQSRARMASIKFTCPSCGGHQIDDNVKIDEEESYHRIFCCRGCGEEVCDEAESILRKMLESEQKFPRKPQD